MTKAASFFKVKNSWFKGLSSRENLLNRSLIRITLWAISIFTLSGNSLVLLGRGVLKDDNKVPILYIRSLAGKSLVKLRVTSQNEILPTSCLFFKFKNK
jgi:hypothetical protein